METTNGASLHEKIKEQKGKICGNSPNLSDEAIDDLEAALIRLYSLNFKDARQKDSLFETVQCLQGYHIVQVFKAWNACRLQELENAKSTSQITRLFEICSQFCYSPDMSKRVPFEVFIRTVKFCFPSDLKKHHFSTEIVLMLLELVWILQEGKLTFPVLDSQKKEYCTKSAMDLFNDLMAVLEARNYDEENIDDIISQASRFARADSKHKFESEVMKTLFPDLQVPFDDLFPAIYFRNWGDLLELTTEGDVAFILRLASEDPLHTPSPGTILPLCHMVNVVRMMEGNGEPVNLCCTEERLHVFFRHMYDIFKDGHEMSVISLKIFSCAKISDADLAEFFRCFFPRECKGPQQFPIHTVESLESIRQVLYEIPDGRLIVKIVKFWFYTFPNDSQKIILKRLFDLFRALIMMQSVKQEYILEEKAEHLLGIIVHLTKMPTICCWPDFLEILITIFPVSFGKMPIVQTLLEKAARPGMEEFYKVANSFLSWVLEQTGSSEKTKEKMVALFMRCFYRMKSCDQFSLELIKSLSLCRGLSVEDMENVIQDMMHSSEHLEDEEKESILAFVLKAAASNESLVNHKEVFNELLEALNHLIGKNKKLLKENGSKLFELLRTLAETPLPSLRTEKIMSIFQRSRESEDGLSCCLIFMRMANSVVVTERTPEHFDLLFSAILKSFRGSKTIYEVFCIENHKMAELLKSATKVCSSAIEVFDLLKEAEQLLCKVDPQLLPLAYSIFSYLVENNVTTKDRAALFEMVASRWKTTSDSSVCARYSIPHILWKTYESIRNGKGTFEAMDHIQTVIAYVKDLETEVAKEVRESLANVERNGNVLRDLERLALNSSLSCEDIALCFHLSCCYPGVRRLTCFNWCADSGSQMQHSRLIPITPQLDESNITNDLRSRTQFSNANHHSFEKNSKSSQKPASLLTPATIAEKMMVQLRRLFGDDTNLRDIAVQLWNSLFTKEYSACPDEVCKSSDLASICDDVVNLFLACLEEAPYFEVVSPWFDIDIRKKLSQHHVIQCSKVVFGSCRWKAQAAEKERHRKIQVAMISLLQELLGSSNRFPEILPFPHAAPCFRGLQPQLESVLCILQKGLSFQITFDLVQLARIDLLAATTIATITSLWPCKTEAEKLLEDVKRRLVEEGVRIHPIYKDFVWSMLEACGRVYRDSSHVLIEKLEWLTDLHGLGVLNYGLDRLPNWRRLMTTDSLPAHLIDKWCVFFLFTPRENISSRDVDAVLDLSPTSLQLVANASENIKRCLFSENGFQGTHWQEEVSSNLFIKEHLRLARLLSELIHILKLRMPEKTFIDANVVEIVVQACNKLCMSHMEKIKKEEDKGKDKTQEIEDTQQNEEHKTKKTEDKPKKGGDVAKKKKEKTKTTIDKKERKSKQDKSKEIQVRTEDTEDKEGEKTEDKRKQTKDKIEETDDEPKIATDKTKSSNPYRILRQTLEALFNEMFAKQSTIVDNQFSLSKCVEAYQGQESEFAATNPVLKGSTPLQHNLPNDVYESMLVLMRRWFSGIANKPTLASKTMKIIQSLLSFSYEKDRSQIERLPQEILSFPRNQLLLSQLQAAGYNQGESVDSQDLWASPFLERSCYLRKSEFPSDKRYETKLTNVLRLHWIQWKNLLFMLNINSVKIDEREVPTKDLFGIQASRVEMEKQVEAVKEKVGRIESEDVSRRVKQLIREEQRHRARVTKLYKRKETKPCSCKGTCSKVETRTNQGCSCKTQGLECGPACKCDSADKPCKNKMEKGKKTKVVAVWENRFLENIKLCSESIPGCYAPNGFHSEKPVICALSVDNRILTVFKEEKGRREEIENVEVKLFDAGLYVYGLYSSGHDYVTDELWAAFYKMLLEKRLVPRIVLSNKSPGFHWIKKFVQPVKEHPCYWKWHLHCGIVPLEEDYLDYRPIEAAFCPWLHELSEFLTLTRINVARFRFRDFTDAKVVERKEQQAREVAGKFNAIPQLEQKLHSLHNDAILIGKLAPKLEFAVKKTITQIVMGEWPTAETVKKHIDMRRLAFIKCEQCKLKIQKCKCIIYQEEYATIVLRVCESVQETLLVLLFYVFLVNLFALD